MRDYAGRDFKPNPKKFSGHYTIDKALKTSSRARDIYANISKRPDMLYDLELGIRPLANLTADNINDPLITLDSSNLMALCEECHAEQHRKRRWRCDALGHISL